jgi:hypothetical protein
MDRLTDLEINRSVRKVLVRHWIDLGRISVRTTAGVIAISGELKRLPNMGPPLTSSTVTGMMNEIRRTSAARRIQPNLTNWVECNGVWKQSTPTPVDFAAEAQKEKTAQVHDLTGLENQSLADLA